MTSPYDAKPWLPHYDEKVPRTLDIPSHTIHHFLEESARLHPGHTAVIFRGKEISYAELDAMANAVAAALARDGFRKGDRAVIYMPNTPQFVILYFGIMKAGGIVIATNPLYTPRELEHQLVDCGAETVFVLSLYYDTLKKVQQTGKTKVKRIIVTNIKEYLPAHLRLLFTLLKEKKEGHRVTLQMGDVWLQDFLAAGKGAPRPGNRSQLPDGRQIPLLRRHKPKQRRQWCKTALPRSRHRPYCTPGTPAPFVASGPEHLKLSFQSGKLVPP